MRRKNKIGLLAKLTKKQSPNRNYFSELPIGTVFIIIEEHLNMPAYDLTGYFINTRPQLLKNGSYYYTGYIEKGTYEIIGTVKDNVHLLINSLNFS